MINLNLSAPNIHGLIKIHKPQQPIRPIVNWKNVPAYKLAKFFSSILNQAISLPNTFNVNNSPQLITDLQQLEIQPNTRLASFDISNKYTNIPILYLRTV
jgi:hypothetical protein